MIEALVIGMLAEDPNFDNTPALESFLQSCTDCVLHIPKGHYYFNTPLKPTVKTVAILGDGMNSTILLKNYEGPAPFLPFHAGTASRLSDMTLGAWSGKGSTALELKSQSGANGKFGLAPDFFDARNINITVYNGATWSTGIDLNGVYRARQTLSGLRDLHIDNVFVFGCTKAALNINTVHGAKIYGQFFTAGGTTNRITFNAWADDKNSGIILESPVLGDIQLWNTISSVIITASINSIYNIGSTVKIP